MTICYSLVNEAGSCTVVINVARMFLSVAFKTFTTYLSFLGDSAPRSIKMLYECDNIDNKYNAVTHLYLSEHPYIFSHIVIFCHQGLYIL